MKRFPIYITNDELLTIVQALYTHMDEGFDDTGLAWCLWHKLGDKIRLTVYAAHNRSDLCDTLPCSNCRER